VKVEIIKGNLKLTWILFTLSDNFHWFN